MIPANLRAAAINVLPAPFFIGYDKLWLSFSN